MTTKQASEKCGISDRRIRILCAEGKIEGAELISKTWYIPDTATKPVDGRIKTNINHLNKILELKSVLDSKRPFSDLPFLSVLRFLSSLLCTTNVHI